MAVRIIADSTADVRASVKGRIKVVPLTVRFGDEEYIDGVTINHKEFYEKLIESDELPTTSQATPAAFSDAFEEVVRAGDEAVVITVSSALSGTYQSAVIASQDYPEKIHLVDSKNVAIGAAVLVELAVQLAEGGMSAKDIAHRLTEERDKVKFVALLDTLEYLKKGGRVSKTVAFAGGVLSIKPVICVDNGEIKILGKARGSKQGNNLLVSHINEAGGVDFEKPLLLGYTGLSDCLLTKYIEDSTALWKENTDNLEATPICSVIGTHAGPGAIAVAFFKK